MIRPLSQAGSVQEAYVNARRGSGRSGRAPAATPRRSAAAMSAPRSMEAAELHNERPPGSSRRQDPRRDPEFATLLFVTATTGCRRGELCGLQWTDDGDPHGAASLGRRAVFENRSRARGRCLHDLAAPLPSGSVRPVAPERPQTSRRGSSETFDTSLSLSCHKSLLWSARTSLPGGRVVSPGRWDFRHQDQAGTAPGTLGACVTMGPATCRASQCLLAQAQTIGEWHG